MKDKDYELLADKTILRAIELHEEMQNNFTQLALIARSEGSIFLAHQAVSFHKSEALRLRAVLEDDKNEI